jgi:hypothetical protein
VSTAAKLLDRLQRVKPTGPNRWVACCPSHEDRSPSLSIRELDDGRILLKDFGGCDTEAVLGAIGLSMTDLFPQPLGELPRSNSMIPARDLLLILDHEMLVSVLILNDVLSHRTINETQFDRLVRAAARIGRARDIASPARVEHAAR